MSVARCREINARLRRAGIVVHEYPGCWTRGNGLASAFEGGVVHHTASGFGSALPTTGIGQLLVDGRDDLDGPLCNWAGNEDGSVTFIAAFPANHAGASGGRSMGPLPVTRLFNPRVLGLEIVYPGTVSMRDAQYRTALVWSRIVADVVGFSNIQRIRGHFETSTTGKIDPAGIGGRPINMPAFRTAAALSRTPPKEDDMTPAQAAQLAYVQRIATENQRRIGLARADIAALAQLVAVDKDVDPAELARVVDAAVAKHTPTAEQTVAALLPPLRAALLSVLGEDNDEQADAIVDALVARLSSNEGN